MLIEPYLTNFRTATQGFEGRTSYGYLDSNGIVTVGIGHAVFTQADWEALPWNGGMGDAAGAAADWNALRAAKPGLVASAYESLTVCRLDDWEIDTLLDEDVRVACAGTWFIPNFDGLPQPVQQACLDLVFNLGCAKFQREYFGAGCKFGPAILEGDWATAAAESARKPPVSDARNAYVRQLILSAIPAPGVLT